MMKKRLYVSCCNDEEACLFHVGFEAVTKKDHQYIYEMQHKVYHCSNSVLHVISIYI